MASPSNDDERSSANEPLPPGRKRKPRPSRGVKNKVVALETQMQQVQNSLQNVTHLLQRVVAAGLPAVTTIPVRPAPAENTSHSLSLPNTESSLEQIRSLEQWVQQIHTNNTTASTTSTIHVPLSVTNPVNQVRPRPQPSSTSHSGYRLSDEEGSGESSTGEGADGSGEEGGLSLMRDMLRKEESARLRADGHLSHRERESNSSSHSEQPDDLREVNLMGRKRKRSSTRAAVLQRGTTRRSLSDPVDLGLCDEVQGKELFDLFFQGAHSFMPVYDPSQDTWQSLRRRSPFSIAAILFVGKRIQDAGKPESELQRRLREHAENIGKTTLFSPIASIEALQAMIILASWGDTGWRPGSHAISIAFDMELYKCLPRLAERWDAWGEGMTPSEQVSSKSLVVGARLWLLVAKMAIEMAYNFGRPLGVNEYDVLTHSHALLNHPSGLPSDSRIIAACELLLLRLPLHKIFIGEQEGLQDLDRALQIFNEGAQAWEIRWQQYYLRRGVPQEDILVSDLTTQRCFGTVLSNSCLLRDIRGPSDVDKIPPYRRRWILASLDNARLIAGRILSTEKDKLLHANHYSHVALASVCRIYIRLASLFPDAVDMRRTAKDLTQLADVLAQFPGLHFAQRLRYVINKARTRSVFPPETRPTSPRQTWGEPRTAPSTAVHPTTYNQTSHPMPTSTTMTGGGGQGQGQSPFDFDLFAAERLLNQVPSHMTWDPPHQDQGGTMGSTNPGGWDLAVGSVTFSAHDTSSFGPSGQTSFLSWLDFPALGEILPAL
ncbi:hypothetical protein IAR55_002582 [Kwoniella newhampshirensis]|uniref:Transcription factor domain-containing protein n=1 Tax=Kwoniella newhampshirensis TaxID=1651941 RepID=A0AAW0Z1W3_9TREE